VGRTGVTMMVMGALALPLTGCMATVSSYASASERVAPVRTAGSGARVDARAGVHTAARAAGDEARMTALQAEVTRLVNADRARAGCAPLAWDGAAAEAAQAHSEDMAARHYFDHTSPEGHTAVDRLRAGGGSYRALAENIAMGQQSAQEVVRGWLESPGHRRNIENCRYTRTGVGYRDLRWTQVFYTPA